MKILLVKVPSNIHIVVPPLSLAYVAAGLRGRAEVTILDCLKEGLDHAGFEKYLRKNSFDLVGCTAMSMELNSALECCRIAKRLNPAVVTVIGGAHACTDPESVLADDAVDFIFRGEAEPGLPSFVEALERGSTDFSGVPGLGYRVGENGTRSIRLNEPAFVQDLDRLPFPDFEAMKFEEYPKLYLARRHPFAPLLTSRGCPFPCTFCAGGVISGKKFRARSPENIMAEIRLMKEKYGVREVQFWDDNFTLDRRRAERICDLLIEEKLDLIWWCPNGVRLETLDFSLLDKMKASGCYAMVLGIESGSEKIQRDMKKNLKFEKLREVVEYADFIGIRTQGFFILGYPTETREDIEATIRLAKSLPLRRATFGLFQPLPGSEICRDLQRENRTAHLDFTRMEYSKPSVLPSGFRSADELKNLQRRALLEFYLRPRVLTRFLAENMSWSQLKELGAMARTYLVKS